MALNYGLWSVPLDYDAPLNEIYPTYVMPAEVRLDSCPACTEHKRLVAGRAGDGLSEAARGIADTFYCTHVNDDRLARELRWCDKLTQDDVDNLIACTRRSRWTSAPHTATEINAITRGPGLGIFDGIERLILIRHRCEKIGIEMYCMTCDGRGYVGSPDEIAAYETWEATDPPTGNGIQMCNTNGDPVPISSVHPNTSSGRHAMATELTENYRYGSVRSAQQWLGVIDGLVALVDLASHPLV